MEQVPDTVLVAVPYQVFINHRGPDVKKTLASLIYNRLTRCHGLRVFLDEKEIDTGDALSPAIIGAIQSASVHVTIFSGRYAESNWCLDELCLILRSHHERNTKIIPVFFDVEPSDLRHIESGRYADAFKKHQHKRRVAMEVLQKWKTALNDASHITGLPFKTNGSDYGDIVEKIVDSVLQEVYRREDTEVAKYPVGLDQAVKDFEKEIPQFGHSNATMIVGIAGMVGAGKSTLAKHLYNLRRPDFSRSSICEVREKGLRSSQQKLLRDLLGNYNPHHIHSISQGKRILQDNLPRLLPVFVVLDDVDNLDHIESLLDVDAVASGSLILITSRDKDVLRRSSVNALVYDVKALHQNHARELFCRHAFCQSKPSEELDDLIEKFLKICGGLPLSLKVLGGHLSGRCEKEYWERQLEKLCTTLPIQIIDSFKVSYEALDAEEKEVFLDIGCFLVGEEKELAIQVLEGLHGNSRIGDHLESLRQKCLVNFEYDVLMFRDMLKNDDVRKQKPRFFEKIGYDYIRLSITMHDQVKQFARHIAREECRRFPTLNPLRLISSDDVDILQWHGQTTGSLQIRGIRSWKDCDQWSTLRNIRAEGVRLFVAEHAGFEDMLDASQLNMSGELVWLRLGRQSSLRSLPSASLLKLRVLEINGSSRVKHLNLNELDLPYQRRHPLDRLTPPPLHNFALLSPPLYTLTGRQPNSSTKVKRTESSGQSSLITQSGTTESSGKSSLIPQSGTTESSRQSSLIPWSGTSESSFHGFLESVVNGMITLTKLVLNNLGFLRSLPIDFSQLPNLRHLDLSGCYHLTELPNTFPKLLQLQYLALQYCSNLSIPFDILGEISTLEYVDFKGCAKLVCLPERIPYQRHLRYLNLLDTGLLELPDNLGILDKLEQITIGSRALKEIPLTIANLKGLTELFLIHCSGLQQISPEGIAAPNIKILAIDGGPRHSSSFQDQGNLDPQNIHFRVGMHFLRDLIWTNTLIYQISIPECVTPRLETIDLSGNIFLMRVNALPSALVSLNLQNCRGLKSLTSLSNLVNLKFLNINRCINLPTLNIEGLELLEEIKAEECWELQRIQGLNQRERLKCVHISTNNKVFWEDIGEFFGSPTHHVPCAIFSGKADNYKMFSEGDMLRFAEKFNLRIIASLLPENRKLNLNLHDIASLLPVCGSVNLRSHGAILVCMMSSHDAKSLDVTFTAATLTHRGSALKYSIMTGSKGGRGVHVFMWTDESRLFKEYSVYSEINVTLNVEDTTLLASGSNVWEKEMACIVGVDKKTNVSQVCRELIMACV